VGRSRVGGKGNKEGCKGGCHLYASEGVREQRGGEEEERKGGCVHITCARRSLKLSLKLRVPKLPGSCPGAFSNAAMPAS